MELIIISSAYDTTKKKNKSSTFFSDEKKDFSIGTVKEKSLHNMLKYYFEPNEIFHEKKIGSFIADIAYDKSIIEIQSKSLFLLKRKLDLYLKEYEVSIVYPVIKEKYLHWINPETSEVESSRKSPKSEDFHDFLVEAYGLKQYLKNKNLKFMIPYVSVDDYRYLDGYGKYRKNRATKGDIILKKIISVDIFKSESDYKKRLLNDIPQPFTTKSYSEYNTISKRKSQVSLNILSHLNIIEKTGKSGRFFEYHFK